MPVDKDQAILVLTNLQRDYQAYADAFGVAIQALQGTLAVIDTEKATLLKEKASDADTIASLEDEIDAHQIDAQ